MNEWKNESNHNMRVYNDLSVTDGNTQAKLSSLEVFRTADPDTGVGS